jgi:precorrin isomerase
MIKAKKGKVEINGTGAEIITDFTMIAKGLYDDITKEYGEEFAKDILTNAFELAFLSKEELEKRAKSKVSELLKRIVEDLESEEE